MAWLYLFIAGLCEMLWPVGFKYSGGFTRLVPTLGTGAMMLISLGLMSLAARSLPMGTVYAVWAGLGAFGTALLGIWLWGESAHPARLISLLLVILGVIGLKFFSPHD